jgi:signal transduction histidine kinase
MLERFVRLNASRTTPGSGLGLSPVAAVAKLYGASLTLGDNAPGLRVYGDPPFLRVATPWPTHPRDRVRRQAHWIKTHRGRARGAAGSRR